VDELKRKTEESEREFEKLKKQRQEEYNRLYEQVLIINPQSSTPALYVVNIHGLLCELM
jgi:hypothetical protein